MFTFYIQLVDLIHLHVVGLFLIFFVSSWFVYLIKLLRASTYENDFGGGVSPSKSVGVIVPVVDEDLNIWKLVMDSLKLSLRDLDSQVVVVANGKNGHENLEYAQKLGFQVVKLPEASKRRAVEAGVKLINKDVTVILDSDTVVKYNSISNLLKPFLFANIGGATPEHKILDRNRNFIRRVSDWLEEVRFHEVVKGQSCGGAVSCLPGRLLAIRTDLLKKAVPDLVNEKFLGSYCISGDDRFLTSWLLKNNFLTVFVNGSVVETNSPDTLKGFIQQRLRWSRTSFRESILSIPWILKYPFTALTVWSTIIFRWLFLIVITLGVLSWFGVIHRTHYLNLSFGELVFGTILGFLVSGLLRQLRHLIKHPEDFWYLPAFLVLTTFVLTPLEWFGNITVKESDWMTRDTK